MTHLVMPTIAFTPKLLHALAAAVPVVLPAWAAAAARTTAGQPLPDVDAFKPAVARAAAGASQTQTLDADVVRVKPERQTLFAGLRFVAPPGAARGDDEKILVMMGADADAVARLRPRRRRRRRAALHRRPLRDGVALLQHGRQARGARRRRVRRRAADGAAAARVPALLLAQPLARAGRLARVAGVAGARRR